MPYYQGKKLTKFKNKRGGKNQSAVDGFYRDEDGKEYFIKKPADAIEFFCELFAGLLLQAFKIRGIIPMTYHASFICTDLIRFDDQSYGLVQPKVAFTELYKIIGTSNRDNSDRDPITEMFHGPRYYSTLVQKGDSFGLPMIFMFSLLLGDNSVHSANVVRLLSPNESQIKQYARIDWGAAFRYFAYPENNQNLLQPSEYKGWFNYKSYTKGYFLNYKHIDGLFSAIADKATQLKLILNQALLIEVITEVLAKIPADLLSQKVQNDLVSYFGIASTKTIHFGELTSYSQFAKDFSAVLVQRLAKIMLLQDLTSFDQNTAMNSKRFRENDIDCYLTSELSKNFYEQISLWREKVNGVKNLLSIELMTIEMSKLTQQYNEFAEIISNLIENIILKEAIEPKGNKEITIVSSEQIENKGNISTLISEDVSGSLGSFPLSDTEMTAITSNQSVEHYCKISAYPTADKLFVGWDLGDQSYKLRVLKHYLLQEDGTRKYPDYPFPCRQIVKTNDSLWKKTTMILHTGYNFIEFMRTLQLIQNSMGEKRSNLSIINAFKIHLAEFYDCCQELLAEFHQVSLTKIEPTQKNTMANHFNQVERTITVTGTGTGGDLPEKLLFFKEDASTKGLKTGKKSLILEKTVESKNCN